MKTPNKKKVLIIDDEKDLCILLKGYLSRKDFEVEIANTLSAGLSKLDLIHPDILFLDNNLPDGSGWDKAGEIVAHNPGLRINLITGGVHYNASPIATSNVQVLEKPLSFSAIDAAVA